MSPIDATAALLLSLDEWRRNELMYRPGIREENLVQRARVRIMHLTDINNSIKKTLGHDL